MAIIACCLILIVIREYSSRHKEEQVVIVEPAESAPSEPVAAKHVPSFARPKSAKLSDTKPESPSPAPVVEKVEVAEPVAALPVAVVPATGEKFASTGLAPLTFLAKTNVGSIFGRVVLDGKPPPEALIKMEDVCGKIHPARLPSRRYVVSADGGLANVFVYISSGLEQQSFSVPAQPVVLNQIGCEFQPYVFGLMTHQDLVISNSDRTLHNVHALPNASGNNEFNVAQLFGAKVDKQFPSREIPLTMRCDIHPWMFAYACVVDHPFFAVTDRDGYFTITNVSSGNYQLTAFHVHTFIEGHKAVTKNVAVKEGTPAAAYFKIETSGSNLARR